MLALVVSLALNVVQLVLLVYMFVERRRHENILRFPLKKLPKEKLKELIFGCPKTDLHLHAESGTNPDLAFKIALRNGLKPGTPEWPWATTEDLIKALNFKDLESFLLIYYKVSGALKTQQDFIDQGRNIVATLISNSVVHAEVFFDPQTFTSRGIPFQTVADGFNIGFDYGRSVGMSIRLIVSILRDSPVGKPDDEGDPSKGFSSMEKSTGWSAIKQAVGYNKLKTTRDKASSQWPIIGVGLDSNEHPCPPEMFTDIYSYASSNGLLCTAHAGEEGPASYISTCIDKLGCARIDHGVRCGDDSELCYRMATPQITPGVLAAYGRPHLVPITCCPMSNYRLKVFPDPKKINIGALLGMGIQCCVNVDDPQYTGSMNYKLGTNTPWVNASWELLIDNLMWEEAAAYPLTFGDLKTLLINGFEASWMDEVSKAMYIGAVNRYFFEKAPSLYEYFSPQAPPLAPNTMICGGASSMSRSAITYYK